MLIISASILKFQRLQPTNSWPLYSSVLYFKHQISDANNKYYTVHRQKWNWYMRKIIYHCCSVFKGKPNPWVHRSVGNSASLIFHLNGGPSGWDIPVPTEHQWWILFISNIQYQQSGKIKIEQQHIRRQMMSSLHVYVKVTPSCYVAYQRIQELLWVF